MLEFATAGDDETPVPAEDDRITIAREIDQIIEEEKAESRKLPQSP